MLSEMKTLAKLQRLILVDLSPLILKKAINLVLKHYIYIADALQIVSAIRSRSTVFVTGDKVLAGIAKLEGLNTLYIG